jgi:glycosyltransferase involved in cell wall biosynthesis
MASINLPKVSVIIPHKNDSNLISRALESILSQTYKPQEIIVVDDHSKDVHEYSLRKIIKTLSTELPIVFLASSSAGLSAARNSGISHAKYEFVAFLDADDEWRSDKLEEQVKNCSHGYAAVHSWCTNVSPDGKENLLKPSVKYSKKSLYNGTYAVTGSASAVLVHRKYIKSLGGFNESLKFAEDLDMWVRLSKFGNFKCVEEPLVKIFQRGNSMQRNLSLNPDLKLDAHKKMIQDWERNGIISSSEARNLFAIRIISISSEYSKILNITSSVKFMFKNLRKLPNEFRDKFMLSFIQAVFSSIKGKHAK